MTPPPPAYRTAAMLAREIGISRRKADCWVRKWGAQIDNVWVLDLHQIPDIIAAHGKVEDGPEQVGGKTPRRHDPKKFLRGDGGGSGSEGGPGAGDRAQGGYA